MKEFVYFLPDAEGGVASVVRNLLDNTSHHDIRTKVVLYSFSTKYNIKDNFNCTSLVRLSFPKNVSDAYVYRKFKKAISPDSIIITNNGGYEHGFIAFFRLQNPVIYIMHGDYEHYFNVLKESTGIISRVVCISDYLYCKVKEQFSYESFLIHAPVPVQYNQQVVDCKFKDLSNLEIVYAGRVTKPKGVFYFKPFVDELLRLGVKFNFHIIGSGPDLDQLKTELSGIHNVKFYGHREHRFVLDLVGKCHISILFSEAEGLPISVVESMLLKTIPVSFFIKSGIPELIDDEKNGYICPPGDIGSIAKIISNLKDCPDKVETIANASYMKATEMFNPCNQTRIFEDLFLSTPHKTRNIHLSFKDLFVSYLHPSLKNRINAMVNKLNPTNA